MDEALNEAASDTKRACGEPTARLTRLSEADQEQQHHAEAQLHFRRGVAVITAELWRPLAAD